jgi:hypothetical protein
MNTELQPGRGLRAPKLTSTHLLILFNPLFCTDKEGNRQACVMEEKREEHCIVAGIINVNPPPSIFSKDFSG